MRNIALLTLKASKFILGLLLLNLAHADQAANNSQNINSKYQDIITTPAKKSNLVATNLMQAVVKKGDLTIAVGQRGHILRSTDQGKSWQQANSPTSIDLLAISLVDEKNIWVSGHDGVILYSNDAGQNWQIQLTGEQANKILVEDLEKKLSGEANNVNYQKMLSEATRYKTEGANKPFLDIWFADDKFGLVVGAYGLIFVTEDGGKNWMSWFDRVENPKFYHLNAIGGNKDNLYLVGEAGKIWKLDLIKKEGKIIDTPYNGSFFDVATINNEVMVAGMRGNVWKASASLNDWKKIDIGVRAGISQIYVTNEKKLYLTTQNSKVFFSSDAGNSFVEIKTKPGIVYAGISVLRENQNNAILALVGFGGLRVEEVNFNK